MSSAASNASHFMPPAATEIATGVDALYGFLLIASLISCILVIGGLIWFAMKYRRQEGGKSAYISHNTTLEFLWSFIPFVIFMVTFVWGWIIFYQLRSYPADAMEVQVLAQKWNWLFTYKNGRKSPGELTVPVGQNVKLVMTSKDVLHSFYVPAFRNKQDVVPGRYTAFWFRAEKEGTFQIFCAEYCGDNHSGMLAKVNVVPRETFDQYLGTLPYEGLTPVQIGQKVYFGSCVACHSTAKDVKMTGPSFHGLWGKTETFEDGSSVAVDENYIRESLMNPNAKIVKGFKPNQMPSQAGLLDEDEIMGLLEYLKTLK